jgi:ADP-ribosylation factor-like protein 1
MGLTFSSIFESLSGLTRWTKEKDVRILMLGLDSAGKVRVAYQLFAELKGGG